MFPINLGWIFAVFPGFFGGQGRRGHALFGLVSYNEPYVFFSEPWTWKPHASSFCFGHFYEFNVLWIWSLFLWNFSLPIMKWQVEILRKVMIITYLRELAFSTLEETNPSWLITTNWWDDHLRPPRRKQLVGWYTCLEYVTLPWN